MEKTSRIFVAGHKGLVGSALVRRLASEGCTNIGSAARADLDLSDFQAVRAFFERERPQFVFLAAARAGGILANRTHPGEFIYSNLVIQTAVLHAAQLAGVRRLLFFGCGCAYPKEAPQPMKEEYLLSGPLEPTSEPYAVAKIAGIKMCEAYNHQYRTAFLSVVPASVYGPHDHFDLERSHVLSALLGKFHRARGESAPVVVWGTGSPRREFLYVDDLADACLFLMSLDDSTFASLVGFPGSIVNVGTGDDIAIKDLALLVKDVVGFAGGIEFDTSKPDGAPRKLLDSGRLRALGWTPKTSLDEGIRRTYEWYRGAA
jgi:GDP-L-fucose synthase